jgi:hypothetical protein
MTMADMYIVVSSAGRRTSMGPLGGGATGRPTPPRSGKKRVSGGPLYFAPVFRAAE